MVAAPKTAAFEEVFVEEEFVLGFREWKIQGIEETWVDLAVADLGSRVLETVVVQLVVPE